MLRILCLEDVTDDAELIRKQIQNEGLIIQFDHVTSENEFIDKLKTKTYDLVLSDYNLAGYDGLAALLISKKNCPDVPFICVSGTIGEDLAAELIHSGASDYILKDRLSRLASAIERSLREAEALKARLASEEEIRNIKEALEKLNQRLIDIREDERASIAREIHDRLGQSLTALKIDAGWLYENTVHDLEKAGKLKEMMDLISALIIDVQRISSELRPSILDDIGLVPAMEWYIREFEKRTGIACLINLQDVQFTNEKKNLVVYRILQEALTNVVRHSDATKVNVNLYRSADSIVLEVIDNGKGLEKEKISSYKSLGFVGIRERLKQHNGTLEIQSILKKETKLSITIPFI
jgi:signal transduction histidine kinase